jgi:hypothetical protein
MIKALDQSGLIERQPGVARSIKLLVPPKELPLLGVEQPVIITGAKH